MVMARRTQQAQEKTVMAGRLLQRFNRALSLCGVVALSVATTLLVQHLLIPAPATAQSIQTSEIRASSFVLVGSDGTVIGRLGPGSSGMGNLTLFDSSGRLHIAISGSGDLLAYGTGGTALAQIYASADTNSSGMILRDPNGNIRVDAGQNPDADAASVRVHDEQGQLRSGIGSLADDSGASSGAYGLRVRDADGNIVTTVP
jgi:hypothetical protein